MQSSIWWLPIYRRNTYTHIPMYEYTRRNGWVERDDDLHRTIFFFLDRSCVLYGSTHFMHIGRCTQHIQCATITPYSSLYACRLCCVHANCTDYMHSSARIHAPSTEFMTSLNTSNIKALRILSNANILFKTFAREGCFFCRYQNLFFVFFFNWKKSFFCVLNTTKYCFATTQPSHII